MSTTFTIKRGDTIPSMVATLSSTVDGVTAAVDLTTATEVMAFFEDATLTVLERECTVVTAASGIVSYTFLAADWNTGNFAVGTYKLEFQVTFAVGEILTVPTTGYCKFIVKQDLED